MKKKLKYSIYTATNNPSFLMDCFKSIKNQLTGDFSIEWVILLNGGVKKSQIKSKIRNKSWVKVVSYTGESDNIGELKRHAVSHCDGDYIVELDHDDFLSYNAIKTIDDTIHSNLDSTGIEPSLLYSDFAEFHDENKKWRTYKPASNWQDGAVVYDYLEKDFGLKNKVIYNKAFEPSLAAFRDLLYAPNHVRVWNKAFYFSIGGYDKTLAVCDDLDLMCRTASYATSIVRIPKCLYFYRLRSDSGNSWIKRNDAIQNTKPIIVDKHIDLMVKGFTMRDYGKAYCMGAGHNFDINSGMIPIDLSLDKKLLDAGGLEANVIVDGLPIETDLACLIVANDFVEHIPHCRDSTCNHGFTSLQGADIKSNKTYPTIAGKKAALCTVALMDEFYRALQPNGILTVSVPSTDGRGAFQDPTHISFWNSNSFWYYSQYETAKYIRSGRTEEGCVFQIASLVNYYPSDWHKLHNILYTKAVLIAVKNHEYIGEIGGYDVRKFWEKQKAS